MTTGVFTGWPPTALDFFDELEANNEKAWFHRNKEIYDADVKGPMVALLDELAPEFGSGNVSRPNRDIRFAADKSPYKTRIYGRIPHAGGAGGYFVQLRAEELFVGGGIYSPGRDHLAALRAAIAADRSGRQLTAILDGLAAKGWKLMADGGLKTAPRGYAADHPRIELLRLPHLAGGWHHPPRKWLHTRAAIDRVVDGLRAVTPLLDWAARSVS